nr:hypothetical protein [uncultured Oscillibacter sp.]
MDGKKNRMPGLSRVICAACRTARWAGRFPLPLEIEGGVEIAQSGETVLFCRDSLADLPPVQLEAHPGLLLADLRGCQVELSALQGGWAEATEAECWVERNGEAVYSGYCGDISRGPVGLEPWTYPFAEGDTLEYHFLCTDQYGLRYDFTLYKRTAEEREDGPSFPGRKNEENLCATSP